MRLTEAFDDVRTGWEERGDDARATGTVKAEDWAHGESLTFTGGEAKSGFGRRES